MIDVGVWFGVLGALIVAAIVTVQVTSPPSPQFLQQQAMAAEDAQYQANRARYEAACMSNPDMLAYVPDEIHQRYCQCLSFYTVGGTRPLAEGRPLKCLKDSATALADRPNIEADFRSVFPAACSQIEQQLTGHLPDHLGGPFCDCLQKLIGNDKARMAEYVIAGGERTDTGQARGDIAVCRRQASPG